MKRSIYTLFIVCSLCVGLGNAYTCYQCEEEMGKNLDCEVNVKNVLNPTCTEGFQCIKYIWTTNGTSVVTRACSPRTKCEELQATATSNHTLDFCETCDSANCNSGFTPSYVTSVVLSVIFFFGVRVLVRS